MIPLKYNIRNLKARFTSTLLTILSTALVVFASCWLFGLVAGLQHSLNVSGDPLDLIVIRKGSTNETDGGFESDKADELVNLPGIARDAEGKLLVARELIHIPVVSRRDGTRANLILRGVEDASAQLRPDFKLTSGRMFTPGLDECIVSQPISRRFAGGRRGRDAQGWRKGVLPRRRPFHGRRQLIRERGLDQPQGPRTQRRPRGLRLFRPDAPPLRLISKASRPASVMKPASSSRPFPRKRSSASKTPPASS